MTSTALTLAVLADGKSSHTVRWVEWLVEAGHDVHLFTDSAYAGDAAVDVRLVEPMSHLKRSPRLLRHLRSDINEVNPSLLHAHFVTGYGHVAWMTGVRPLVVTAWGSDLLQAGTASRTSRALTQRSVRAARLCTADSPPLLHALRGLGVADRARLVGFGISPAFFTPGDRQLARQQLGLPSAGPIVLSARSLTPLYNIETAIHAFAELQQTTPSAHLLLKDYFGDARYQVEMHSMVAKLGLTSSVTWLGPMPAAELPTLYSAADVVLSLAATDSFPLTMWETFAQGRLLVASRISGVREAFAPIDEWLLATPDDPHDVARALRAAISLDDGQRTQTLMRFRQASSTWADVDTEMGWLETLYDAALNGRALPTRALDET